MAEFPTLYPLSPAHRGAGTGIRTHSIVTVYPHLYFQERYHYATGPALRGGILSNQKWCGNWSLIKNPTLNLKNLKCQCSHLVIHLFMLNWTFSVNHENRERDESKLSGYDDMKLNRCAASTNKSGYENRGSCHVNACTRRIFKLWAT